MAACRGWSLTDWDNRMERLGSSPCSPEAHYVLRRGGASAIPSFGMAVDSSPTARLDEHRHPNNTIGLVCAFGDQWRRTTAIHYYSFSHEVSTEYADSIFSVIPSASL